MGRRPPPPPPDAPFHNPFGALERLRGDLPPGEAPAPPAGGSAAAAVPARAVLRYERKGHGGREVTCVEKLELDAATLEAWLGEIRRSLGCGGRVSEDGLVLQGDQRDRLRTWLLDKGVKRVSG